MDHDDTFERLDAVIAEATPEERSALVVALAARLATLAAVGLTPPPSAPPEAPDRNLDVGEVARRLGMSERYVYRHRQRLPFMKTEGTRVVGSERALARYLGRT